MKSSLWAAPRTQVYCDKISCPWVRGYLSNEGVRASEGTPLKRRYFAVIGSFSADRYRHAYKITSTGDGLLHRWPWTPKRGFFVNLSRFRPPTHILRVNCTDMAG